MFCKFQIVLYLVYVMITITKKTKFMKIQINVQKAIWIAFYVFIPLILVGAYIAYVKNPH